MTKLIEKIIWEKYPIPAGAGKDHIDLAIGKIGENHPVGLVTAGIHGDEGPWGTYAIRKMLEEVDVKDLKGSLRVIPTSNPLAMEADTRNAPIDILDLNRVFPGKENGTHTERLSAEITKHAVNGADIVIDLHGGGSWCINSFVFETPENKELAGLFNPPFIVNASERNVNVTGYAKSLGAKTIGVEMGGRCEFELDWAGRIARGLKRVFRKTGVFTSSDEKDHFDFESIHVGRGTSIKPSRGGLFVPEIRAPSLGTKVKEGTVLGRLLDPFNLSIIETYTAPYPETAILLLRPTIARI